MHNHISVHSLLENVTLLVTVQGHNESISRHLFSYLQDIPLFYVRDIVRHGKLSLHYCCMASEFTPTKDGCEESYFNGTLWPETDLGLYAMLDCPCSHLLNELAGQSLRLCGGDYIGGAHWSDDISTCVALTSVITGNLCQAATVGNKGVE